MNRNQVCDAFESQQRRHAVWAAASRLVEVRSPGDIGPGPDGAVPGPDSAVRGPDGSVSGSDGSVPGSDSAARIVRYESEDPDGWAAVVWSDLAGLSAAQVEAWVAGQAAWARRQGRRLEWKYYHHDRPAGLPKVLVRNGFEPEDLETVMVADVAELGVDVALPEGLTLLEVHDEAGLALVARAASEAFGTAPGDRGDAALYVEIARQLRESPQHLAVFVVLTPDGTPVSEGRVDLPPAGDFAGLWGGATVTAWRRQGIYRALVAHRAALAAERGYRWLMVDASSQSRPILQSLGFVAIASTTPHVLQP